MTVYFRPLEYGASANIIDAPKYVIFKGLFIFPSIAIATLDFSLLLLVQISLLIFFVQFLESFLCLFSRTLSLLLFLIALSKAITLFYLLGATLIFSPTVFGLKTQNFEKTTICSMWYCPYSSVT